MHMDYEKMIRHSDEINELLARYGVKFGIYKNNEFKEQLFPYDMIPRIIEKDEFSVLEKGLAQRVVALNLFIKDIYSSSDRRRSFYPFHSLYLKNKKGADIISTFAQSLYSVIMSYQIFGCQ